MRVIIRMRYVLHTTSVEAKMIKKVKKTQLRSENKENCNNEKKTKLQKKNEKNC